MEFTEVKGVSVILLVFFVLTAVCCVRTEEDGEVRFGGLVTELRAYLRDGDRDTKKRLTDYIGTDPKSLNRLLDILETRLEQRPDSLLERPEPHPVFNGLIQTFYVAEPMGFHYTWEVRQEALDRLCEILEEAVQASGQNILDFYIQMFSKEEFCPSHSHAVDMGRFYCSINAPLTRRVIRLLTSSEKMKSDMLPKILHLLSDPKASYVARLQCLWILNSIPLTEEEMVDVEVVLTARLRYTLRSLQKIEESADVDSLTNWAESRRLRDELQKEKEFLIDTRWLLSRGKAWWNDETFYLQLIYFLFQENRYMNPSYLMVSPAYWLNLRICRLRNTPLTGIEKTIPFSEFDNEQPIDKQSLVKRIKRFANVRLLNLDKVFAEGERIDPCWVCVTDTFARGWRIDEFLHFLPRLRSFTLASQPEGNFHELPLLCLSSREGERIVVRYVTITTAVREHLLWWLQNRHKYPKQMLLTGWDENEILLEFVGELRKDKDIATKYKDLLDATEQEAREALEEQKDAPGKPSE